MNIQRFLLAVLTAAIPAGIAAAGEQPLLLGVLEQPGCRNMDRKVRVLYAHTGEIWVSLDTEESAEAYDYSNITWTVAFDGRDLGRFQTVDPGLGHIDYDVYDAPEANRDYMKHRYPIDRLLDPAPGAAPPRIANKNGLFGGMCGKPIDLRPVVVVSRPNFRDPAKWKPFRPGAAYGEKMLEHVAKRIRAPREPVGRESRVERCYYDPEKPGEELIAVADIVFNKSYRNNGGQELISVSLAGPRFECPVVQGAQPLWFLIDGARVRYIGETLTLVDAGDYDGDGSSEVLFLYSWRDSGGYRLFYGGLAARADFDWNSGY